MTLKEKVVGIKCRENSKIKSSQEFKVCVRYNFVSLLNKSTFETRKNVFLHHFKSSFRFRENQILEFYIFNFHNEIKCLNVKQEIHFTD